MHNGSMVIHRRSLVCEEVNRLVLLLLAIAATVLIETSSTLIEASSGLKSPSTLVESSSVGSSSKIWLKTTPLIATAPTECWALLSHDR